MFRTRKYAGTTLSAWPVIRGMCLLSIVYKTAKTFGKSKTVSIFSSSSLFTRKVAAITAAMQCGSLFVGRHICYAMFTPSRGPFLESPENFSVRKATCETANRLFWKADLLTCFQAN